jgi:uncharacterized protein YjbI with pentapeptide repeats
MGKPGPSQPAAMIDGSDEFVDTTFRQLVLDRQALTGKDFDACTFESCSFQEAEVVGCAFRDVRFVGCSLAAVKLTNSRIAGVTFTRSKVIGVDWTAAQWSSVGTPIVFEEECTLDYSVFFGLKLKRSVFRDCSAREVDFTEADLSGSDFSGTDLSGARFHHTKLRTAHLEGAVGYLIDPTTNDLAGARVSLPEAGSLIRALGITIVDAPRGPEGST